MIRLSEALQQHDDPGKNRESQIIIQVQTYTLIRYQVDTLLVSNVYSHISDISVCSGSVVVNAYDSESGRPGSNPEWGLIYYEASITAQGLPEPSSLHWVPEQLNIKAVTGACKLIDGCSLALCSATVLVISAGICHRNEVNSIA